LEIRYLWKSWENGKLKMLVMDLNKPLVADEVKEDREELLVSYFCHNLHSHNYYAFKYFLCELLNFANVVGQIYFMDMFLGGEFTTYGSDVVRFQDLEPEERVDPMAKVFPKVTKCTFHTYGASGTVQNHDGLCVLPLNIVNEKIMVFLWFWFVVVAVFSGLALVYRALVVALPPVRGWLLRYRSSRLNVDDVDEINAKCRVGDWFLLYLIGKSMDPLIFEEFVHDLAGVLKGEHV
jgi:hypothetical protein